MNIEKIEKEIKKLWAPSEIVLNRVPSAEGTELLSWVWEVQKGVVWSLTYYPPRDLGGVKVKESWLCEKQIFPKEYSVSADTFAEAVEKARQEDWTDSGSWLISKEQYEKLGKERGQNAHNS